jgi:hypothetical protein
VTIDPLWVEVSTTGQMVVRTVVVLVTVVTIGLAIFDDEYPVAEHTFGQVVVVSVMVRVIVTSRSLSGAAKTVPAKAHRPKRRNRMLR